MITWIFVGIFFLSSSIFFITQVQIFGLIDIFQAIGENFDSDALLFLISILDPLANDDYYQVIDELLGLDDPYVDFNISSTFLNEAARNEIPAGLTFAGRLNFSNL